MPTINIKVLPHGENLPLPIYQTAQAAGADICAAVEEDVILQPRERKAIPTGLAMAIPAGYEVQIRPRSGLSIKNGVTLVNAPGTIDADYRGEVHVILINLGQEPFTITRGLRIAQCVVNPVPQATFVTVDNLDETDRGTGGFGSTGTHS